LRVDKNRHRERERERERASERQRERQRETDREWERGSIVLVWLNYVNPPKNVKRDPLEVQG